MLMIDSDIQEEINKHNINISPCSPGNLRSLAYVARLGKRALIGGHELALDTEAKGALVLPAGEL